jgi:hypothetical protein
MFTEGETPCVRPVELKMKVLDYVTALHAAAPGLGSHGLSPEEFWATGIFEGAIEQIRGTQSANMSRKREFVDAILSSMRDAGKILGFEFTGADDRHDYHVRMPNERIVVIETKGCLDGNNTNIFERPPEAEEFYIWSICQNRAADPRHNAWSGIHTRLGAEYIANNKKVDALIIWDWVCGTPARPCPKLVADATRSTTVGEFCLPPPCFYIFPTTKPDPRNNPSPRIPQANELAFVDALHAMFKCRPDDVTSIQLTARMNDTSVQRKTELFRCGQLVKASSWGAIKRASR